MSKDTISAKQWDMQVWQMLHNQAVELSNAKDDAPCFPGVKADTAMYQAMALREELLLRDVWVTLVTIGGKYDVHAFDTSEQRSAVECSPLKWRNDAVVPFKWIPERQIDITQPPNAAKK